MGPQWQKLAILPAQYSGLNSAVDDLEARSCMMGNTTSLPLSGRGGRGKRAGKEGREGRGGLRLPERRHIIRRGPPAHICAVFLCMKQEAFFRSGLCKYPPGCAHMASGKVRICSLRSWLYKAQLVQTRVVEFMRPRAFATLASCYYILPVAYVHTCLIDMYIYIYITYAHMYIHVHLYMCVYTYAEYASGNLLFSIDVSSRGMCTHCFPYCFFCCQSLFCSICNLLFQSMAALDQGGGIQHDRIRQGVFFYRGNVPRSVLRSMQLRQPVCGTEERSIRLLSTYMLGPECAPKNEEVKNGFATESISSEYRTDGAACSGHVLGRSIYVAAPWSPTD